MVRIEKQGSALAPGGISHSFSIDHPSKMTLCGNFSLLTAYEASITRNDDHLFLPTFLFYFILFNTLSDFVVKFTIKNKIYNKKIWII